MVAGFRPSETESAANAIVLERDACKVVVPDVPLLDSEIVDGILRAAGMTHAELVDILARARSGTRPSYRVRESG
jgi:hypothetical protein